MQRTAIGFYIDFNAQFTGGPRNLYNLVRELDKERFEPVVVTNKPSAMVDALREIDIEPTILELPAVLGTERGLAVSGGIGTKLGAYRALKQYNRQIQAVYEERGVKLVWVRNIKGVLFNAGACKRIKAPLIWDIGMEKDSKGFMWLLHMIGFRKAARVVTEGEVVARSIFTPGQLKRYKRKLVSNPTGVPADRVAQIARDKGHGPPPYDPFRILNVASVNPRKNQMMMLKAVNALKDKHPHLRVWFAGPFTDDDYKVEVEAYVAKNGLEPYVEFLGWQDDVASLLHQAHLFALTSHIEGVAQAVLEAVHAHAPILSTACGGIPEVVRDGQTGRLVPIGDDEAFKDALDDCLSHPERLAGYADKAKELVHSRFMAELWYQRYENLFEELLAEGMA